MISVKLSQRETATTQDGEFQKTFDITYMAAAI